MNLNEIPHKLFREYVRLKRKFFHRVITNKIYVYNEIPFGVLPKSTRLYHLGIGIVINGDAKIGENCDIGQNVTIGARKAMGSPIIEDWVAIFANSCVIGNIRIGHHSKIATGSTITVDVPPYSLAYGVNKIIKDKYRPDKKLIEV